MARSLTLVLLAATFLILTTGCLGEENGYEAEPLQTNNPDEPAAPLALEGSGCTQGGGHSVHPQNVAGVWNVSAQVPEPWIVADVLEDTGDQFVYSEIPDPTTPVPEEGNTWGHYHATLECDAWTFDGQPLNEDTMFGFVGPKVQTPPFANTSADNEYLATVIATNHDDVYERFHEAGIDVMHATGTIEHQTPSTVRIDMHTSHNGDYLSIYELHEIGPLTLDTVRLWSQSETPNRTFTPLAVDIHLDGGTHYGAQQQGYFHHMGTAHHWPLPGAGGTTAAVHYDGFDVRFTWGPMPTVALDAHYDH